MLQENEVVMLIMGIGVMALILANRIHVKKIKFWRILVLSYTVLLTGWIFTVLEGFILENLLNISEHVCYMLSACLLITWCWKSANREKKEELT